MSDGVWIALIAAFATVAAPIITALVNHRLGNEDRDLASRTVEMKNRELRAERARNRRLQIENRKLRLRRARPKDRP